MTCFHYFRLFAVSFRNMFPAPSGCRCAVGRWNTEYYGSLSSLAGWNTESTSWFLADFMALPASVYRSSSRSYRRDHGIFTESYRWGKYFDTNSAENTKTHERVKIFFNGLWVYFASFRVFRVFMFFMFPFWVFLWISRCFQWWNGVCSYRMNLFLFNCFPIFFRFP